MRMVAVKRIYEPYAESDGLRILVDRLWPRGMSKDAARIDLWVKELAPSHELRKWYQHDPSRWSEFRRRYFAELDSHPEELETLFTRIKDHPATFLYSSREQKLNNAVALREYLLEHDPAT